MLQMFPGLRALYTMANVNSSGEWVDESGKSLNLTSSGVAVDYRTDLNGMAPAALFSASSYLAHADDANFDIIGNESYIRSAGDFRGLTVGGWFRMTATTTQQWGISKWLATGNQRSYLLRTRSAGSANPDLILSGDGSATVSIVSSQPSTTNWLCIFGRYRSEVPDISIFVNGIWDTNSTSIPSAIFDSTSEFRIGDPAGGSGLGIVGRVSQAGVYAAAVPDVFIDTYYQMTAPLFGVSV
jgi:hypothetical protein